MNLPHLYSTSRPRLLGSGLENSQAAASPSAASTCAARGRALSRPARRIQRRTRSRRSGIALIYTALGMATFLGVTALVVDMGRLYTRRAQAQRAADAASLAGALELYKGEAAARQQAIEYARFNGYDINKGVTIQTRAWAKSGPTLDRLEVFVQRPEPLYFLPAMAALMGLSATTSRVGATSTAEASYPNTQIDNPISYGAGYGSTGGFANMSVFGQDARYEHGDAYSTKYLSDGRTLNKGTAEDPRGDDFKGYEYTLNIGPDFVSKNGTSEVQLEIFDPDCYVADTSRMLDSWDELHDNSSGAYAPTTTTYTLLKPKLNVTDPDEVIATASYGADASTNLKWTTPNGFKFDLNNTGGPGAYTLRVKGGAGTSENGFQLRAGKPHDGLRDPADYETWKNLYNAGSTESANGTSITSRGKAVLNFVKNATVDINMGFVPADATKVFVDKFDTDVGFQSISYSIKKKDGTPVTAALPAGVKAEDGRWAPTDELTVPSDYPSEGAYWYVSYTAGAFDTSNWVMSYQSKTKESTSAPSSVRLVK